MFEVFNAKMVSFGSVVSFQKGVDFLDDARHFEKKLQYQKKGFLIELIRVVVLDDMNEKLNIP